MRWMMTILALGVVLTVGAAGIVAWAYRSTPKAAEAATRPALAATQPVAKIPAAESNQREESPRIQAYADLIRTLPGMADSSLSDAKLPLEQVARVHLPYWVYICPRKEMWVAHPEAMPLASAPEEGSRGVHLTREQVVFVHWVKVGRQYRPYPVYRDERGAFRVFRRGEDAVRLARFDYHWADAISLDDVMVVPTDLGVSVIRVRPEVVEDYKPLTDRVAEPAIELTPSGFVAWIPSTLPSEHPTRTAWFSGGNWKDLPADEWSGDFVHLVPYADGSVLQVRPSAMGTVQMRIATLETLPANAGLVKQLVEKLSDEDAEVRDNTHAQLVALGPAAWSLLEKQLPTEHGESAIRIGEIIQSRTRPKLGRFELVDGMLRPIWRMRDGVVFLAEAGVKAGSEQEAVVPAWISIRRGQPITMLPPALVKHLAISDVELFGEGGEWIVSDGEEGARLFFGQELLPLTKLKEKEFGTLCGIDRNARILLRKSGTKTYGSDFLLIDPSIADPTPVLQVWNMSVEKGIAGWTEEGYPALKRGAAYALKAEGWEAIKTEPISSVPAPATRPGEKGVLTEIGGRYAGWTLWSSATELVLKNASGRQLSVARPREIPSQDLGGLVVKDRAYLFHTSGMISRLRLRPSTGEAIQVDALFTQDVPSIATVVRAWLDPAGRMCVVTGDGRLIIYFVSGQIPPAMLDMIPADELRQARPKD